MIYEKKITKKEIFSYAIFIAIIALICIFKNEIWEFVKFIFSNLDFICGNFANFVGEDNIVFFPITTLLIVFTIAICAVWGLSNILSLSLFIMPIFVAVFYIFNIDISLKNLYGSYFIFLIIINGLSWSVNQR
ncbi:hypothetical protein MU065_001744 [Campylobacter coli]|uniref:Uncharacterized protein n=3 Tax=Campylobacter coli TaxID=195 RepID=A0A5Y7F4P0_CAMCO|nr:MULTISPECIES: hypothetical protein [Campylobacter]AOH52731.1 hypothetical protein CJ14980A_a0023 [Campylobacter jejuni subsp. jejuni]EAH4943343.1 hypothetical protein [Campylobacter coli]EAH4943554.1 hypothetical protein [Campylobacter coli]EAH5499946.1 hypothetical protein [Campylobacter coli]EAH5595073.1 hypothetical protein [Campylobacter jejuni]